MTSYPRSALFLVSAALLAACGGRSQLRDSSGAGGAGPSTSTTSVSSGGGFGGSGGSGGFEDVGGSGGMLGGCVVDGPPIGLAGTEGYFTSNPVFVVPVQVDSTTLVAAWKAAEGPMNPPTELRHTSFQAWGPWPANGTLGPSYLASYDGDQGFYAAPSFTDFNVVFANPPPANGLTYVSHLTPGSGALGMATAVGSGEERPCFVERSTDPHVHLLGFSNVAAGVWNFDISRMNDPVAGSMVTTNLGCSINPIVAGAAPSGADFLVAFASGSPFKDPGCAAGTISTPALWLFVARVTDQGKVELAQQVELELGAGTITSVKMVSRLDGAWLAWTDTVNSDIHVLRLDPSGKSAGSPVLIPFSGDVESISATTFGDRLALAWSVMAADAPSQIRINLVSAAGNVDVDLSINLGPQATGRTAILGSPANTSLLLAWSEEVSPGPQLRLARLACSLP